MFTVLNGIGKNPPVKHGVLSQEDVVSAAQAEFFGPGGNYTLRWNIVGSGSINCSHDVSITLSSCSTLDFDGINDNVTFQNHYNLSSPFSFEIWVKPNAQTHDKDGKPVGLNDPIQTIFSKHNFTKLV